MDKTTPEKKKTVVQIKLPFQKDSKLATSAMDSVMYVHFLIILKIYVDIFILFKNLEREDFMKRENDIFVWKNFRSFPILYNILVIWKL